MIKTKKLIKKYTTKVCIYNTRSTKNSLYELQFSHKKLRHIFCDELYNFVNNDCISYIINKNNQDSFNQFIKKESKLFRNKIINRLKKKYQLRWISNKINQKSISEAYHIIKSKKFPIIISAPFKSKRFIGIFDLLIRNDYINKIFPNGEIGDSSPKNNSNLFYINCKIIFKTLKFAKNSINILNSKTIKTELFLQNIALNEIFDFDNNKSIIIARYYKQNSKRFDSFQKIGLIDFDNYDKKIKIIVKNGISFIRKLDRNRAKWKKHLNLFKIPNKHLYPNLKLLNNSKTIKRIGEKNNEITKILYCGVRQRAMAFKNNIFSWKNKKCTSKCLGLKNERAKIVDCILKINKQNKKLFYSTKSKILSKIENKIFVDFEFLTNVFVSQNFLYLIGVYFKNDSNVFEYKSFVVNELLNKEEERIIKKFYEFIKTAKFPTIFYWFAEKKYFTKILVKYNLNQQNLKWFDLHSYFISNKIVIKGCFTYKLKDIYNSLLTNELINKVEIPNECNNGISSMIHANNYFKNKNKNKNKFQKIILYNKFDCKVLYEILNFLQK